MAQPRNAVEINYTRVKTRVIPGENFRYAGQEIIENAKKRLKKYGRLLGYFEGADLYLLNGSVIRFNGDSSLKLLSETQDGLEKLTETLGLPN